MAGMAVSSPASRCTVASASIAYPRPGPDTASGSPGPAVVAQRARAPPSWTTTSTSSVRAAVSTRRGVSVRSSGRVPSGIRNSLPFHVGITRSVRPGGGRSRRTLAAGRSRVRPAISSPPSVTRTSRGVTDSVPTTCTVRNEGGSRRERTVGSVVTRASWHARRICPDRHADVLTTEQLLDLPMLCGWYHAISSTANAAGGRTGARRPTFVDYAPRDAAAVRSSLVPYTHADHGGEGDPMVSFEVRTRTAADVRQVEPGAFH